MCNYREISVCRRILIHVHIFFTFRDELRKVYNLIYGVNATADDKAQAHLILQTWKIRRGQETLTGILCTLSLLDVHVKVRNVREIVLAAFLTKLYRTLPAKSPIPSPSALFMQVHSQSSSTSHLHFKCSERRCTKVRKSWE